MVLVGPSADANFRIIPRKTDGTAVLKVNNGTEYALSKNLTAGEWNAIALVYNENDTEGTVAVYLNGEEVLAASGIGFKLSEKTGIVGAFGATYGTGFMRTGLYDNIVVTGTAAPRLPRPRPRPATTPSTALPMWTVLSPSPARTYWKRAVRRTRTAGPTRALVC